MKIPPATVTETKHKCLAKRNKIQQVLIIFSWQNCLVKISRNSTLLRKHKHPPPLQPIPWILSLDPPATEKFCHKLSKTASSSTSAPTGRAPAGKQDLARPWMKLLVPGSHAGLVLPGAGSPCCPPAPALSSSRVYSHKTTLPALRGLKKTPGPRKGWGAEGFTRLIFWENVTPLVEPAPLSPSHFCPWRVVKWATAATYYKKSRCHDGGYSQEPSKCQKSQKKEALQLKNTNLILGSFFPWGLGSSQPGPALPGHRCSAPSARLVAVLLSPGWPSCASPGTAAPWRMGSCFLCGRNTTPS